MLLFLLTFITLYTGMHALVFWGIHPLLSGHRALPSVTWIWMGLMILAPIAIRLLDRAGHQGIARALAWVGYSWMGLLFLAFSLFVILGLWHLATLLLAKAGFPALSLHGPVSASVIILFSLATGLYGLYEAHDLRLEEVSLVTSKLPPGVEKVRIVQVSDLHLGLIHRQEALAPIISSLEQLQPDLLVATGDIVDAQIDHLDGISALWRRLQPPLGKFAVTGNHEYYAGLQQGLEFLRKSGFQILRGESLTLADTLAIVGVDDPAGGNPQDEAPLLEDLNSSLFTILLKHRPRINEQAIGLFDLQLSGHAHRGQIFPFNFLTALEYPRQNGRYELGGGSVLYSSRGTGTWGPPMRVLSPPEITLFTVSPQISPRN